MTMTDSIIRPNPDPHAHPEFYQDTVTKRLLAWFVDVAIIALIALVLSVFTLFTVLLIFPLFYAVVSFAYRWFTLAGGSATLGMRVFSLELRQDDGAPFDALTAFLHTAGYFASVAVFPAQLISIGMMLMTERRQGLTDTVLGTVAINRRA
ncbi:MAG: RDD family protein [Pseudomonadota bacterium]